MKPRSVTALALAATVALAFAWTLPLSAARGMGWDEAMHAALPAARMLVAVEEGEPGLAADALLDCSQYPFAWPVALALVQAATGLSEHAARVAGTLAWCAALFATFLAGRELVRARAASTGAAGPFAPGAVVRRRPFGSAAHPAALRGSGWIPWLALALAALSPLALAYAGTLFLEVPFAAACAFALRAWIARGAADPARERRSDLAAGAWIALAFFAKFNYGVLLALGLGADAAIGLALAARRGRARGER